MRTKGYCWFTIDDCEHRISTVKIGGKTIFIGVSRKKKIIEDVESVYKKAKLMISQQKNVIEMFDWEVECLKDPKVLRRKKMSTTARMSVQIF